MFSHLRTLPSATLNSLATASHQGRHSFMNISEPAFCFRRACFALSILLAASPWKAAAQESGTTPPLLKDGYLSLDTPDFALRLARSSQTAAALQPKAAPGFDFTPTDWLQRRAADGYYHLGDLILRVRKAKEETWLRGDTAAARRPVIALPTSGQVLAAADLSSSLPADWPVQVTRSWVLSDSKHLALRFEIKNIDAQPVEIGALGIPMAFNNIITDRSLEQAHEVCSFADPCIGQDAGYLQVTRLNGKGPALVVVPEGETPFEAYQPLNEPMPRQQTFEGMLAWMAHSRAYAENEWRDAKPWNAPTSATLEPGQTRTYGVRFLLAPEIRHIEKTLADNQRPVAVGIPGYILPSDLEGRLFLNCGREVKSMAVEPADAIDIRKDKPTAEGWQAYTLRAQGWGRARLTVTYEDGLRQSISYYLTKPAMQAVNDLGRFLMTKQWFVDPDDPFHRSPSVISYDREKDRQLTQESRVWIAGLGDEGGTGSWLAAAMKQFGQPNPEEVAKYEQFIDNVLWGVLQYKDGPNRYGVRKSAFYYSPKDVPGFEYDKALNWRSWTSWNKTASEDIGRGYNYPHIVAAYWAMYRIARNHPGLVKSHPWEWYLEQASQTMRFAFGRDVRGHRRVGYVELGLMEGTVFLKVLEDLKHEEWKPQATEIEALMKERADRWKGEAYPFGSEMAWDSTGQEEVYAWCNYFGYEDKARVTLDSILGYMPNIPHWGYHGNVRRYWDFLYGGKIRRIERQIHHYGSGLNAIPMLTHYRQHPGDFHLLRVGYGGAMGPLTNIDSDGFASAAFHSFPSTLQWDAYSGDYGPNFFSYAINAATYLIDHPQFGWQAFGGNVQSDGEWVRVAPHDAFRMRIYLAPRGLWLTLDAGAFEAVELNARTGLVRVGLTGGADHVSQGRLRVEQPAKIAGVGTYQPLQKLELHNDAYRVDIGPEITWVELKD
jgi:hypothetical protein